VPVAAGERSPGAGAGVCGEAGRCFCFDGPYRRLRWRRGGSGPPMRTVSPAPVAERRIGSSNADRIAGSGGGEADRVLQCGPYRRLRWRRGGSGPPMRTEPPALVPEDATGSPSWSASRRDSPLPSWEPGRPEPAAVVDALRSPGRAPTSRACRRGLRVSGRGLQNGACDPAASLASNPGCSSATRSFVVVRRAWRPGALCASCCRAGWRVEGRSGGGWRAALHRERVRVRSRERDCGVAPGRAAVCG
jgi:hypothetical protein